MADGYDIGKAYVQVLPSTKDFSKTLKNDLSMDLEKEGESQGNAWAGGFKKAAMAIGATIAAVGAAAVSLGKEVVSSYGEYQQVAEGAQLLFGDAYDFIAEKAASAWEEVQMSQTDYLTQVNGLSTGLKEAMGGNAMAAAELASKVVSAEADVVAATGASQEAVQNAFNGIMKSNYTMLDNLQLGIKPTKEGMQEVIDKVNEWNAANGNATSYMIDNLADCQSALVDYIEMQGLADYASMEGAKTIQGSLSKLSASWQNFVTALGDDEADMEVITQQMATSFNDVVTNITPVIENVIAALPVAVEGLMGAFSELLPKIIASASSLFEQVLTSIVTMLPELIPVMLEAVMTCVNAIIDNIQLIIEAAVQIIVALIQGLTEAMPELIPVVIDTIILIAETLLDNLDQIISAAMELIIALIMGLIEALPQLISYLPTIITTIVDTLIDNIDLIIQAGVTLLTALIANLPQIIVEVVKAVPQIIWALVKGIGEGVVEMAKAGLNLLKGLWEGITSGIDWLWQKIKGWLDGLWESILGFFGIHSPSTEMAWVGEMLTEGLAGGIDDGTSVALKAVDSMDNAVTEAMNGMVEDINKTTLGVAADIPELTASQQINKMVSASGTIGVNTMSDREARIIELLESYLPQLIEAADKDIYLDGDTLVGGIATRVDDKLSDINNRRQRGGLCMA